MPHAQATDGTRLHYQVLGRAESPAVLMIQGLGADKHGWDLQRIPLSLHYRVIALDNRGAGRSDKPLGAYSLEQMADDAIAVLDAVGVERAHIVGASMGGAIAQIIGLKYAQRVLSLTLACTACRIHPWRRELLQSWATTAAERGMSAMTREAARWVIGPRSFRRLLPAIGWLGTPANGRPAHAFISQVRAILDVDESISGQLALVEAPTLVIVGNQDILTPRGDSEEIADLLPNAELVVISGAAHGLMVEHASTFNRVVLEFLSRVTPAGQSVAPAAIAASSSRRA
jgi:3-oxoadipate enol-lactonase